MSAAIGTSAAQGAKKGGSVITKVNRDNSSQRSALSAHDKLGDALFQQDQSRRAILKAAKQQTRMEQQTALKQEQAEDRVQEMTGKAVDTPLAMSSSMATSPANQGGRMPASAKPTSTPTSATAPSKPQAKLAVQDVMHEMDDVIAARGAMAASKAGGRKQNKSSGKPTANAAAGMVLAH